MANVAKLNSTGALFETVRAACDFMAVNANEGVTLLTSVIGGAGFGLLAKDGNNSLYGVKQPDGSYPVVISLGVSDSGPDRLTYGKAILNIESGVCEFGNFTLRGAEVSAGNGGNGAGVRINAGSNKVTGRNFKLIGNQNGLLTDGSREQELLFEDFVLDKNAFGREGYTHNAYFGLSKSVTVRRGEFLNARFGHDFKSRSLKTVIEQTRMSGSAHGRALDLSNGGIWISSNNEYIKPDFAEQNNLVHLMPEGNPDGRPEKYESTNDLFQIDIQPTGRGLQFVFNQGNAECVLTDPKFVLGGRVISDLEAAPYLVGNVRIVDTGGVRGPLKPVGCAGDILGNGTGTAPVIDAPAPTPAPTPAPVPTPAPTPKAEEWVKIGNEGEVVIVDTDTTVRYGANGQFVTKVFTGVVALSNDVFGDPISGVAKVGERLVKAATAPTPTPVPTPAPAPVVVAPAPTPTTEGVSVATAMVAGAKAFLESLGYKVTR